MNLFKNIAISLLLGILFLLLSCQQAVMRENSMDVHKRFENPPAAYRPMPLWVWNDRITREQIDEQLADFHDKGYGGVFVHPRPGLITPYLSDEWMELFKYTVATAKKLQMEVWIYDENSYPSGFAGGHVPDQMPDSRGAALQMTRRDTLQQFKDNPPVCVLQQNGDQFENVTKQAQTQDLGVGTFYVFTTKPANPGPWFGGFYYVDLMRRDVTQKFLSVTLDAYKKAIGEEFGGVVPGTFQDEAHVNPAGGKNAINYTPALFDAFQKRWGYDLRLRLVSLLEPVGDYKQVRHNYYQTILELFIDNWAKPYYEYCEANHLKLTGHYWEHAFPWPHMCPDNMALTAYAQMPGIDLLMNQWSLDVHAQFGSARIVKELGSVANQLGRHRTLSETYGAAGWDLSFLDQKRIGDWEYALGVNFMNPHLSYVTIMGARKRDHPQSFSYHEPWWKYYRTMMDYFGRLGVALTAGDQINPVLVLEPTSTMWMYYVPGQKGLRADTLGQQFQDFVHQLEALQVEYDLGCEDIMRNHGSRDGAKLVVGKRSYSLVVLPPGMENLDKSTYRLLEDFISSGGRVLACNPVPAFIDGISSTACADLAKRYPDRWLVRDEKVLAAAVAATEAVQCVTIHNVTPANSLLFHHTRQLQDGRLTFVTNISDSQAVSAEIRLPGASAEQWDLFTGQVKPYPFTAEAGQVRVPFQLQPGNSLLLFVSDKSAASPTEPKLSPTPVSLAGTMMIERRQDNVLTIDYCDLEVAGHTAKDLYFYDAQRETFKQHGLERNPWDSAVQFKTNIIDKDKFAPESGFTATYWLDMSPGVAARSISVVVERAELYAVSINGKAVAPEKDEWWLDKHFSVFKIGELLKPGRNSITLQAKPFTIHTELEPIYVRGDFGLASQAKGFRLVAAQPLRLGAWKEQGLPFYSEDVAYRQTVTITSQDLQSKKYCVALSNWKGIVAEAVVNDKPAGLFIVPPYRLDITSLLQQGENTIEVRVTGSLKNLLGPHHNNPPVGSAWPGMFQKGAPNGYPQGKEYDTRPYGLLEGFSLLRSEKR